MTVSTSDGLVYDGLAQYHLDQPSNGFAPWEGSPNVPDTPENREAVRYFHEVLVPELMRKEQEFIKMRDNVGTTSRKSRKKSKAVG